MRGKSHLVAGAATLATTVRLIQRYPLFPPFLSLGSAMVPPLWVGVAFFMLGCVLPDCDSETSLVGRYFYLPVEHRTWTHTLWVPLVIFVVAHWFPILNWLALGYLDHLWMDALSTAGVAWLYPLTGYKYYDSGAFVKRGVHNFKLYRMGDISEYVVCAVLVLIAVVFWW